MQLTVSGIKCIADVAPLGIPVLNMARSRVKTQLGCREIADSCLRRLRALLPDRKCIGRPVLLLGYGTLGSRLAPALRTLDCLLTMVDTDLPTLIDAAEAGYTTYRTAGEALRATRPFLVIGTAGEEALTEEDLRHLDDGALLAPFATRDFSLLSSLGENAADRTEIQGVGTRLRLPNGRHATLLGDGRSLNLFEADSIPNQGYDAYRAGTLIAAAHLCAHHRTLPPGLHTAPADQAIADAGLFQAYFELHLAPPGPGPGHPDTAETRPAGTRERPPVAHACVVGYGVAGRLHTAILEDLGVRLTITDPHRRDLPERHRGFTAHVDELPAGVVDGIDLWSVCTPTADHLPLPVVRAILARRPDARVLLEKPACRAEEIDVFADLLTRHPRARVVVNDQYRHSAALPALSDLRDRLAPDTPIDRVAVTFTKERRGDIDAGRFVDRDYGVLGYEWPHMLAVLDGVLPTPLMRDYVASDPASSQLWATYDPELFVTALTERTSVKRHDGGSLPVDLASSILGAQHSAGPGARSTHPLAPRQAARRRPPPPPHRQRRLHALHGPLRARHRAGRLAAGAQPTPPHRRPGRPAPPRRGHPRLPAGDLPTPRPRTTHRPHHAATSRPHRPPPHRRPGERPARRGARPARFTARAGLHGRSSSLNDAGRNGALPIALRRGCCLPCKWQSRARLRGGKGSTEPRMLRVLRTGGSETRRLLQTARCRRDDHGKGRMCPVGLMGMPRKEGFGRTGPVLPP
ncbi:hypothetical protein [Streptomyces sedi]|uniref:hypothetical protein n=1 Tax=Streptomyces sedi TaxID=555059 RepID=UPI001FECFC00|nr:hypothetical protein [Streptomyces sedi]